MEWFRLEEIFKILCFQPLYSCQGYLPLDKVTQSSVQPGLECLQEWGKDEFIMSLETCSL